MREQQETPWLYNAALTTYPTSKACSALAGPDKGFLLVFPIPSSGQPAAAMTIPQAAFCDTGYMEDAHEGVGRQKMRSRR